jgi:hypothetical protein
MVEPKVEQKNFASIKKVSLGYIFILKASADVPAPIKPTPRHHNQLNERLTDQQSLQFWLPNGWHPLQHVREAVGQPVPARRWHLPLGQARPPPHEHGVLDF